MSAVVGFWSLQRARAGSPPSQINERVSRSVRESGHISITRATPVLLKTQKKVQSIFTYIAFRFLQAVKKNRCAFLSNEATVYILNKCPKVPQLPWAPTHGICLWYGLISKEKSPLTCSRWFLLACILRLILKLTCMLKLSVERGCSHHECHTNWRALYRYDCGRKFTGCQIASIWKPPSPSFDSSVPANTFII